MRWTLRPAVASDAAWIAELRADVLRADLERLGRYDPERVRTRFLAAFDPALTKVIVVDGADSGTVTIRPSADGTWIEHFYLSPHLQGRGIGTAVLTAALDGAGPFRLNVLQGSPARRLYERMGFALDSEDEVDVFLVRR
ncbi:MULTISPECIES: GNAT family N-acetyltransferase [Microbacterium]|uniref:N-acetyltransferase n=1 Tax=Microbacterium barkeri TaxID=33917 RepID=A0A9W6LY35_9MICO|nr:GNAT family N-acetyltransferase [Microbacterium barkeri]MDR6876889.1 GNAT superfamily N-acetyltransferase [Microbacterium barkeri]GLJ63087.1 N-acetyltransferase [Microbacterium barkeri]